FSALPALNAGFLEALILMVSPVRGLRPVRAPRLRTEKVPKPTRVTVSPFFRALVMAATIASTARPASALDSSAPSATASMNSALFICMLAPFGIWGDSFIVRTARRSPLPPLRVRRDAFEDARRLQSLYQRIFLHATRKPSCGAGFRPSPADGERRDRGRDAQCLTSARARSPGFDGGGASLAASCARVGSGRSSASSSTSSIHFTGTIFMP